MSEQFEFVEQDARSAWRRSDDGHRVSHWWLVVDGVTVGYAKTHLYQDERSVGARFVLCDIEVRDGYRGRGLARRIIEHVEAQAGQRLHTTGGFTPLGAAALMGRMPVLPNEEAGIKYDDMTFVHDWDEQVAKH